jgi:hypothetical protein
MSNAHRQHYLPNPAHTAARRKAAGRVFLALAYTAAVAAIVWELLP